MPSQTDHSKVSVNWGEADGYWDVSFTDAQKSYASVHGDEHSSISVHVDETTGVVTLNNGYAPGNASYDAEQRLFNEFEPAIVQALVNAVTSSHPEAKAFQATAGKTTEERLSALRELDADVYMKLVDLEDDDDDDRGDD